MNEDEKEETVRRDTGESRRRRWSNSRHIYSTEEGDRSQVVVVLAKKENSNSSSVSPSPNRAALMAPINGTHHHATIAHRPTDRLTCRHCPLGNCITLIRDSADNKRTTAATAAEVVVVTGSGGSGGGNMPRAT